MTPVLVYAVFRQRRMAPTVENFPLIQPHIVAVLIAPCGIAIAPADHLVDLAKDETSSRLFSHCLPFFLVLHVTDQCLRRILE